MIVLGWGLFVRKLEEMVVSVMMSLIMVANAMVWVVLTDSVAVSPLMVSIWAKVKPMCIFSAVVGVSHREFCGSHL